MKLSGTIGVTQKTMTLDTHVRLILLQTLNPQERWGTHKKRWPFQPRLFADVIGLVRCSYHHRTRHFPSTGSTVSSLTERRLSSFKVDNDLFIKSPCQTIRVCFCHWLATGLTWLETRQEADWKLWSRWLESKHIWSKLGGFYLGGDSPIA